MPVAITSAFNTLSSASDCIDIAAVIACHLAASAATIPVDVDPADVRPGIFGMSPSMYACGFLPTLIFTGFAPGTVPKIVPI